MAIIQRPTSNAHVFYQQWDEKEESGPEAAIIINQYTDVIGFAQNDSEILLSNHELKAFIKHLQSIAKSL